MKKSIRKVLIVGMWLCLWQVAAMMIDNDILLAGPVEVSGALLQLLKEVTFYQVCMASLGRILAGFFMAFVLGVLLGGLCYRFVLVKEVLEPVLSVMKSIPVASFVVLLLIWQGSEHLSVWISFFVVLPNACVSTENGLKSVDVRLKEMADVFQLGAAKRILYIYRPAVAKYLISGMEISIGMAFKSGAAAEVIGMPEFSIGERIYMSKIYLDTPGLFAWTLALIFLSFLMEKLILSLLNLWRKPVSLHWLGSQRDSQLVKEDGQQATAVCLKGVSKSFGEKQVLSQVSCEIAPGACVLLMGESGSGKTTLLRIMAGLEQADEGTVFQGDVSYLFQEDRLLESEFTITNIMSTCKKGECSVHDAEMIAAEILPVECLHQKAAVLSGGMKRRLALIRTLLYRMQDKQILIILDEPFAGLDDENKRKTADFINRYKNGRTLIVATHDETDATLLGGNIWNIQK